MQQNKNKVANSVCLQEAGRKTMEKTQSNLEGMSFPKLWCLSVAQLNEQGKDGASSCVDPDSVVVQQTHKNSETGKNIGTLDEFVEFDKSWQEAPDAKYYHDLKTNFIDY